MHRHGEDDEVGVEDDLVGRCGASPWSEHLNDQRDAIGSSGTGDGYVVAGRDGLARDRRSDPAGTDNPQAPVAGLTARHRIEPALPWTGSSLKSEARDDRPGARAPAESPRVRRARWSPASVCAAFVPWRKPGRSD